MSVVSILLSLRIVCDDEHDDVQDDDMNMIMIFMMINDDEDKD